MAPPRAPTTRTRPPTFGQRLEAPPRARSARSRRSRTSAAFLAGRPRASWVNGTRARRPTAAGTSPRMGGRARSHGFRTRSSWASSTSRPTRSPTAASGSTATRRSPTGCALVAEGAAILDVGGESTRPGRRARSPRTRSCGASCRVVEGLARRRRAALDRHDEGRGRRGRARRRRRPTSTTSPRCATTPTWRASSPSAAATLLPDAHARRAAHDAGRPALRRRRRRRQGVPRATRRVRRARGRRRGPHRPRPGHRLRQDASTTTSSCCAALDEIVALGLPRRRRHLAQGVHRRRLDAAATPHERVPGTIAANVLALERGARVFRVHDVAQARRR